MRRVAIVVTLVGAMLGLGAAPALAHECIVANRSDTGNQGAASSSQWLYIGFDGIAAEFGLTDPADVAAFKEAVEAAGLPTSFSIFLHHVIGATGPDKENYAPGYTEQGHSGDFKGVDHLFTGGYVDAYFEVFAEVFLGG